MEAHLHYRYTSALRTIGVNPPAFRNMLRITGSVISGSFAFAFLQRRTDWRWNDVDIYVAVHRADEVLDYLEQAEGFQKVDFPDCEQYPDSVGIAKIVRLQKHGIHIDLVVSTTHSSLYPLPFFWSTGLMNYVAADSYGCAYPSLSCDNIAYINPRYWTPTLRSFMCDIRNLVPKYSYRGLSHPGHVSANDAAAPFNRTCPSGWACPLLPRSFADAGTLAGHIAGAGSDDEDPAHSLLFTEHSMHHIGRPGHPLPQHVHDVHWILGGEDCGAACGSPAVFSITVDNFVPT